MTPLRDVIAALLLGVSAIISGSCQVVAGYEDFERSEPTEPLPQTRACDAIAPSKAGLHGPVLLRVDDPDRSCFWMDKTEVTAADYREWLAALAGSAAEWNSTFCAPEMRPVAPEQLEQDCDLPPKPPASPDPFADEQPMRCVNWCEAEAYCRWAGKGLCKVSTPTSNDEWRIACSAGYTLTYPFDPSAPERPCNFGQDCSSGCGPLPAAQDTSCQPAPGYPLNLGGNVEEWIDACSRGADGTIWCGTRGGSYRSPQAELSCSTSTGYYVYDRSPELGFRCCSSLTPLEESLLAPD